MASLRTMRFTPACKIPFKQMQIRSYATKARSSKDESANTGAENTWNGGAPSKAQVSTLPNGLRVASISSNRPAVSLGLFLNSGSRHEDRHTAGVTQFLKHTAYLSSSRRLGIELVQAVETSGSTLQTSAGREHLVFSSETVPDQVPEMLEVLADMMHPRLQYHEVSRKRPAVEADSTHLLACPVTNIMELVHRTAYRNKGLGQSLVAPDFNAHHIDFRTLRGFVDAHYKPENTVVVGLGVNHDEFVSSVQSVFEKVQKESEAKRQERLKSEEGKTPIVSAGDRSEAAHPIVGGHAPTASAYTGGETLQPADGSTHIAIAFEGLPIKADPKKVLALGVLQHILGSGIQGSFSGHQIGTGVTSRLVAGVLNTKPHYKSIATFNLPYSDSGLFGVYGEAEQDAAGMVRLITAEIEKFLTSSEIPESDLARGKAALKLAILERGEQRRLAVEFIGAQVLATGEVKTSEEIAAQVDSITARDVASVAKAVLSSTPTVVATGDVADIPPLASYELARK